MRADRLISLLMLLQNRGQMTAQALAEELEVSERTIYRDVDALSYSGVPVYTERGPGGGISLVEQYRSDLTGLTRDEVKALFMVSVPTALAELGLDQELKAALLKLSAALPSSLRGDPMLIQQRIHIDPIPWKSENMGETPVGLEALQKAVWDSLEVEIIYHAFVAKGIEPVHSVIWPLGLVAKAENWFIVSQRQDHMFVLRLDRIQSVQNTGESFIRPEDFNLVRFWEGWCQEYDANRPTFPVKIRVSPAIYQKLGFIFRDGYQVLDGPDEKGWFKVQVHFEYHEQARRRLLVIGGAIEVLEPVPLRYSIRDYAAQILAVYPMLE